jgi:hypothetical protein
MFVGHTIKTFLILTLMTAGIIAGSTCAADNTAPVINSVPKQYILEGETLRFTVTAVDPDGDQMRLGMLTHPIGATFTDNRDGSGTFEWKPDYLGPYSSQGSPYTSTFWATDGITYSFMTAEIVVVNNNRAPDISTPEMVNIDAGDMLSVEVSGFDPDYDTLTWLLLDGPAGLVMGAKNPAVLSWQTAYTDSGRHDIRISLVDQYGAADTADLVVNIAAAILYNLSVDTVSGYPGEAVSVDINLMNLEPILGFNVLVNYDFTALTITSLSQIGTRSAYFEYFQYSLNYRSIPGDVVVTGVADLDNGIATGDLQPGDGPLVTLKFLITSNLSFAGYAVPVDFVFRDLIEKSDNTLTDPSGDRIEQDAIDFSDGFVRIKASLPENLGDINLNGVPYEIGDAIYFTNYFIDPRKAPLNPVQVLNSDVNQDGRGATVADLVYLINILLRINYNSPKLSPIADYASVLISRDRGQFALWCDTKAELGAVALTLRGPKTLNSQLRIVSDLETLGMKVRSSTDGGIARILIYSDDGYVVPSGRQELFRIEENDAFEIDDIQISTADGFLLQPLLKDDAERLSAAEYELLQNYPNPFNPSTEIKFHLPEAQTATLEIFNVRGQKVICLLDEYLPAGSHSVIWDGRDAAGQNAASGIYFYRLTTQTSSMMKKMILLK